MEKCRKEVSADPSPEPEGEAPREGHRRAWTCKKHVTCHASSVPSIVFVERSVFASNISVDLAAGLSLLSVMGFEGGCSPSLLPSKVA